MSNGIHDMKELHPFPGHGSRPLAEVGGKALSLLRLADANFPVPGGVILTTAFFDPWFAKLQGSQTWDDFKHAPREDWPALCAALQSQVEVLEITPGQAKTLAAAREHLAAANGPAALFAARSSSPDEDLASASFAGGYETVLGVCLDGFESAVRTCFRACLDLRVFTYKLQNRLDVFSPRIAIVIQSQINSEVAGVGFSLDPISNDYDEAVISSNWGLGETVVAGLATPDHFVIDKLNRRVLSRQLGAKQVAHWLDAAGGTKATAVSRASEYSLDDAQLLELADVMCRVESLFDCPIDIEWAYAEGRLHLLQARPVTTFVPLPPEMSTRPGEPRRLYTDIALASGLTINAPISTMGLEWMREVMTAMFTPFIGDFEATLDPRRSMWFFAGHRMYQDLSNVFWIAAPETIANAGKESDALMSETLKHVDRKRYRARRRPSWLGWSVFKIAPRFFWGLRGLLWDSLFALLFPRRAAAKHHREVEAFQRAIHTELDSHLPLGDFLDHAKSLLAKRAMAHTFPALIAYIFAHSCVERVAGGNSPQRRTLAQKLKLGFKGNVVAEMGIALRQMAGQLEPKQFENPTRLLGDLEQRELPPPFLSAWDDFTRRFGCRGPMEMDIAQPRYGDEPSLALAQMAQMAAAGSGFDPKAAQQKLIEGRLDAFRELMQNSGWIRRPLLRRVHTLLDLFGPTRDTPKHQLLQLYQAVRLRILQEGTLLQRDGRMDTADDVFDLSFEDLERARTDERYDLRAALEERLKFKRQLERQVSSFPGVIDSRGRILRPPVREEAPGEIHGTPISNGTVIGPVKVLRRPDEKTVEPGDVLVAYTTDPGWTPLFVNAAAILLEVGGVLQHGAVVAREYGKPCIAGIDRVLTRLKDGQQVEVDGSRGIIRILSDGPDQPGT